MGEWMEEWMEEWMKEWSNGERSRWCSRAKRRGGGADGGIEE
jgi:hypothetical protein